MIINYLIFNEIDLVSKLFFLKEFQKTHNIEIRIVNASIFVKRNFFLLNI